MSEATYMNLTFGVLMIGVLITAIGYGITILQAYLYFSEYRADLLWNKLVVWSLLALNTLHVALSWHSVYYYLVINFGNHDALQRAVWSLDLTIVNTAVITLIAHLFFSRRMFLISSPPWSYVITVLVLLLSVARMILGCVITAKAFIMGSYETLANNIAPLVVSSLGAGAIADLIIMVTLVYHFRKNKTGFERTDSVMHSLILYTVNTGLWTTVAGITVTITMIVLPKSLIFLAVHLIMSGLYTNSVLATLNFRKTLREQSAEGELQNIPINYHDAIIPRQKTIVHVFTHTITDADQIVKEAETPNGARSSSFDSESKLQ